MAVILSEAKNLTLNLTNGEILRFAQDDIVDGYST